MAIHLTPEANPTVQEGTLYVDSATGEFNVAGRTTPHIIPGVLYPAVSGKLLDGTTSHSGNYGTSQSDGRSYYYTDIKGSKPIKDPRIGGHFGSQRHKLKSLQFLEQETATHGGDVFSVDGKEYFRVHTTSNSGGITMENDGSGVYLKSAYGYQTSIEIVGYFSGINLLGRSLTTSLVNQGMHYSLDGVALNSGAEQTDFETPVSSPLGGRYVDASSLVNAFSGQTLGIHTFTLREYATTEVLHFYGIELIAQDTSSTANRSKIQIPSQNVVSFGKKFTVSGTPHYDPFTTMSYGGSGTTLSALQSLIDTDTSLGMDAWKAGTSNYHRPWNGGRVIKWVDSSGTIKTSVNMMPPNAQNITTTAQSAGNNGDAVTDAHVIAGTNDNTINFNTSAIDHSQSEVAKTFHFREFGNGSANGGTNSSTYADASMLSGSDNIAYVMDDGLTSFYGDQASGSGAANSGFYHNASGAKGYITFIGTGFRLNQNNSNVTDTAQCSVDGVQIQNAVSSASPEAQNLPFGTHVITENWVSSGGSTPTFDEFTFFQPKRPPIPEDACVLADYMLMADFVRQSNPTSSTETGEISKGVRTVSPSRDIFYDDVNGFYTPGSSRYVVHDANFAGVFLASNSTGTNTGNSKFTVSVFGTTFVSQSNSGTVKNRAHIDGSVVTTSGTSNDAHTDIVYPSSAVDLGVHTFGVNGIDNVAYSPYMSGKGFQIVTPIHTSHHYQSFENPFLHELVGGDRNMEQTNLVVSPDGKTWDEVTRDVSYLSSSTQLVAARDGGHITNGAFIWDTLRGGGNDGTTTSKKSFIQKNIAVGYDKIIILKEGLYQIEANAWANHPDCNLWVYINTTSGGDGNGFRIRYDLPDDAGASAIRNLYFKRGDYIYTYAEGTNIHGAHLAYNGISITKLN